MNAPTRLSGFLARLGGATAAPSPDVSQLAADVEGDLLTLQDIASLPRSVVESRVRRYGKCIPYGDQILLSRVLTRYKLFLNTQDDSICGHLAIEGYWEFWNTAFLCRAVRPGTKIVEVGANVGYFTNLLCDLTGPEGRVVAFEPWTGNADLLERSVALNGFSRICRIDRRAVADQPGLARLQVPDRSWGGGSIMGASADLPHHQAVDVAVTTLDDWCDANGYSPDFIKIDAEGAEQAIWRGMRNLRRNRPSLAVMFEFETTRFPDWRAWFTEIVQEDMRLYRVSFEGLPVPLDIEAPIADGDLFEVLAVRGDFARDLL